MSKQGKNNNSISKKILIMGLDNSGKTSITLSLQGISNLLRYAELNPTKNYNIVNFDILHSKFSIWDFGGQKEYRDKHFKNLDQYFPETDKIIYVIDVQDIDRYDIALDYLEMLINKMPKKYATTIELLVFIHKCDPDLDKLHPEISDGKLEGLINKVKAVIPSEFNYKIMKTTIFTTFKKEEVY
ncbi:MAG: hypothetical protein GF383_09590 [Candidatus Lokiarchaeota archaeon]|nr:hypothetical protein [Candidatus Lokiarchaeota archaeon]MBD3340765.1 hypothetical protein [Candidatus Lokiarchaeota archaeon]